MKSSFAAVNASAGLTPLPIKDFSNEQLGLLWAQVYHILHHLSYSPGWVADDTTGDVLGQHYYLYMQDFARLKALGTPWYSPSISWPRLFPFGKGPVNEEGLKALR